MTSTIMSPAPLINHVSMVLDIDQPHETADGLQGRSHITCREQGFQVPEGARTPPACRKEWVPVTNRSRGQ
jgi:hypothetical protein